MVECIGHWTCNLLVKISAMLLPGSVLSCLEFELSGYTNSGNSFEFNYNILVIGLSIGPEKPPWHSSQLN